MRPISAVSLFALLCILAASQSLAQTPTTTLGPPTELQFKARVDGSTQLYLEMLPVGFEKSQTHSLLIALHGGGCDRRQYATDSRGECRGARDVAAKYNMIYICPDLRGEDSDMGPKAEADLLQIIRTARKKYKIDRVFLVGASLGACNSLSFTALHPELINGVSAQNAHVNYFYDHDKTVSDSLGGLPKDMPLEYKRRSAEYWPERFTMPVAITVGGKDPVVPPDSARRFIAVLQAMGEKALLIDRPENSHMTSYEDTVAALEFVVKSATPDLK